MPVNDASANVNDRPHVLYRFFNKKDQLLYVGITCNPGSRWPKHADDKPWWTEVARSTMDHFPNRQTVLKAETLAIKTENPKYNVQQSATGIPSGPSKEHTVRAFRLSGVEEDEFRTDSLVGSFFHSDAKRGWQGCVIAQVTPGVYLVETFSWMMGESFEQQLVRIEEMIDWSFYDTAEWMNNAYKTHVQYRWDAERAKSKDSNDKLSDDDDL